jgi:hypothetical protein
MNKIIQKWRNIPVSRNFNIDTVLFADDQSLLTRSEDDLRYSVCNVNGIVEGFCMEINAGKTKIMAFRGKKTSQKEDMHQ